MVEAMGDIVGEEKLSPSLYVFKCYLLCLYEVLTMALYSAVVDVNSNFRTLSDCQNQTGIFNLLLIFGTHVFPNDKDVIEFICLLPSTQDKQRIQQKIVKIWQQR